MPVQNRISRQRIHLQRCDEQCHAKHNEQCHWIDHYGVLYSYSSSTHIEIRFDIIMSISLIYFCLDINECETGEHDCDENRNLICINKEGSFNCKCNDSDGTHCNGISHIINLYQYTSSYRQSPDLNCFY